jgi:uncharacterized protein YbjT (DUF2867 family)
MNLVVGATGVLGTEICRLLVERGKRVRGFVRSTSNPERCQTLQKLEIELAQGDLKDRASLVAACRGVENVISTATSIVTRQEGDSFHATDRDGHFHLIEAAQQAGARRFVFISFPPMPFPSPIEDAKRAVEQKLSDSDLAYTVLQPVFFQEVWLGPHLGFDYVNGNVRIYGEGKNKISWISFRDVAKLCAFSLENPDAARKVIPLGGPEALSPLEVVATFEEIQGRRFKIEHVPENVLRSQYDNAPDPISKTFTGLMLGYTRQHIVDMTEVLKQMPVSLGSVRDYAYSVS